MAKTSSRKQGAPTISEPLKAATKSPSSSRAASWPTGKAPRPLLEAKAPPLKIVPQRGKAAAKTAKAAPDAATPSPAAKGRTPAPRRAERRSLSEIQTAPAPAKPLAASRATQAAAKPAPVARPEPSASAGPPASAPAKASVEGAPVPTPDVEALAHNIAQAIELGGKALAAYLAPRQSGEIKATIADDIGEMVRSIGRVAEYYMAEPQRAFAAQTALTTRFVDLWAATLQRLQGETAEPIAPPRVLRQALRRRRVARQSVFRFHQAGVCPDHALGGRSGQACRRARAARSRQGAILPAPGHRGAVALELRRDQSGAHAHDARRKRREPRAWPQDAG